MKHCRNCDYWKWDGQWRGICTKDYFTKPQWSESASPNMYACDEYAERKIYNDAHKINIIGSTDL